MVDFIKLDTARLERASTGTSSSTPSDQPDPLDVAAFNSVMGNEQDDTGQQHSSDTHDGSQEGVQGGVQGDSQKSLQGGMRDSPQEGLQGGVRDSSQEGLQGGMRDSSQEGLQGGVRDSSQKSLQGEVQDDSQEGLQGGMRDSSQENDTTDDSTEAVGQMLLGMTNPLDSLFGNRQPSVDAPTATPVAADMPAPLTEKLVERILVSQPAQGESEVRLSLNQDTLPDTEIRLNRGADGLLSVTLITNDASSFQTLVSAQDTLKQRLAAQENGNVQVTVTSGTEQENNDSRRRSRGYQEETHEEQGVAHVPITAS